jgi:hypothetical protein
MPQPPRFASFRNACRQCCVATGTSHAIRVGPRNSCWDSALCVSSPPGQTDSQGLPPLRELGSCARNPCVSPTLLKRYCFPTAAKLKTP